MKKIFLIALLSTTSIIYADNDNVHLCGDLIGSWYGTATIDKSINCNYDVDASISIHNPGFMRMQMRSKSGNPLCNKYFSERLSVSCNIDHIYASSTKMAIKGIYRNFNTDVYLDGTILSRLHYHQVNINLHKK